MMRGVSHAGIGIIAWVADFALLFAAGLLLANRLRVLRKQGGAMGAPRMFVLPQVGRNNLQIWAFLLSGKHRDIGDQQVSGYVYLVRFGLVIGIALLVVPMINPSLLG